MAEAKAKLQAMVNRHWEYVQGIILSAKPGGVELMGLDERHNLKTREYDYKTGFADGHHHGVEESWDNDEILGVLESTEDFSFVDAIRRQKAFALKAFGPGDHSVGLVKHIKQELVEISEDPMETEEWIDVLILAMEGAWRSGANIEDIGKIFDIKMSKNERREWPETNNPNEIMHHIEK